MYSEGVTDVNGVSYGRAVHQKHSNSDSFEYWRRRRKFFHKTRGYTMKGFESCNYSRQAISY